MAFIYISFSDLPKLEDLKKTVSAILVNSHIAIHSPKPLMPGIINVAGVHIKPAKPLPTDIQKFMDDAKEGVIYFSTGSIIDSSRLPQSIKTTILKVFGSLKQKVLMKMNPENITELPSNILVKQFVPQSDVIAHKNCILFVSHGGYSALIEAITNAVPMLIIPFIFDQVSNAIIAESKGFALKLYLKEITEQTLKDKINELLDNEKYREKANEISRIFNDNPRKPLDEATYWIEYVARHKGAKHLKSGAINLPFYKYLLLDVLLFTIFCWTLAIWLIKKLAIRLKKMIWKPKIHVKKTTHID
jgi:glucuronosyltransferase